MLVFNLPKNNRKIFWRRFYFALNKDSKVTSFVRVTAIIEGVSETSSTFHVK